MTSPATITVSVCLPGAGDTTGGRGRGPQLFQRRVFHIGIQFQQQTFFLKRLTERSENLSEHVSFFSARHWQREQSSERPTCTRNLNLVGCGWFRRSSHWMSSCGISSACTLNTSSGNASVQSWYCMCSLGKFDGCAGQGAVCVPNRSLAWQHFSKMMKWW